MKIRKEILQFIYDNYGDQLNEAWHDSHDRCGGIYCEDAGGGVVTDEDFDYYKEELAENYYNENKKEVDTEFNFEKGNCQEFKNPLA